MFNTLAVPNLSGGIRHYIQQLDPIFASFSFGRNSSLGDRYDRAGSGFTPHLDNRPHHPPSPTQEEKPSSIL